MNRREIIKAEEKLNPVDEELMGIGAPIEAIFSSISEEVVAQLGIWGFTKTDEQRLQALMIGYTKSDLALLLFVKMKEITGLKNELKHRKEIDDNINNQLLNNHAEN